MVANSIDRFNLPSKLSFEITNYLEQQTLILEYLRKAKAKIQVSLSDDFLDYDFETIHHYLWGLNDRIEITVSMFENLMDIFNKLKSGLL